MDWQEFTLEVLKRKSEDYKGMLERMSKVHMLNMKHAADGLATEAGELLDQFKKHIYYGKPLDMLNVKEELGDALFYIALLAYFAKLDIAEIQQANVAKLHARFGDCFDKDKAINRDLDAEERALDNGNVHSK